MINKYLLQLQQVEKLSGIFLNAEKEKIPYKRIDQTWIRADKPLSEIYSKTLRHSELQFYPNTNYKAWGIWLLTRFKLRKSGRKFSKLLGIGLNWSFTKPIYLSLQTDVIYYRKHTVIMIYSTLKRKRVIKAALTKNGETSIKSQIEGQRIANAIESEEVYIPKIIKESVSVDHVFLVEEFFVGKKQSFNDDKRLSANYKKAYKFMVNLYLHNPIELQHPSKSKFLDLDFVEEHIGSLDQGKKLLLIYKELKSKKRNLILCRVHGDLNHHNLLSKGGKLCIIDWAESKHYYISADLESSSYNTEHIFDEFVQRAKLDKNEIYSYHEQLFLGLFIEMSRLIHIGLKRGAISDRYDSFIKSQNKRLIKISDNL